MIKKDPSTIVRNDSPKKTNIRKDWRGTIIVKGQKGHHLTFVDQITKIEFAQIVSVDSFKEFNTDMSNPNENCSCKCLII
jgi:hypothetical protein